MPPIDTIGASTWGNLTVLDSVVHLILELWDVNTLMKIKKTFHVVSVSNVLTLLYKVVCMACSQRFKTLISTLQYVHSIKGVFGLLLRSKLSIMCASCQYRPCTESVCQVYGCNHTIAAFLQHQIFFQYSDKCLIVAESMHQLLKCLDFT